MAVSGLSTRRCWAPSSLCQATYNCQGTDFKGATMQRKILIAVLGVVTLLFGLAGAVPAAIASSPTVPGAPTGLGATPGDTTAVLSWTAPSSDGGSAITGY